MTRIRIRSLLLLAVAFMSLPLACMADGTDKVYEAVEQMPQFKGGQKAMNAYFLRYFQDKSFPKRGMCHVEVSCVIGKGGTVSDAKAVGDTLSEFSREAVRAVLGMPKWVPGRHNGQAVSVRVRLPLTMIDGNVGGMSGLGGEAARLKKQFTDETTKMQKLGKEARKVSADSVNAYISLLKKLLMVMPDHPTAPLFLIRSYLSLGDYQQAANAIDFYEGAKDHLPLLVAIFRGYAYDLQGMKAEADAQYALGLDIVNGSHSAGNVFDLCYIEMLTGYLKGREAQIALLTKALDEKEYEHGRETILALIEEARNFDRMASVRRNGCLVEVAQ